MVDPLISDAKAKAAAFETKQVGWLKLNATPFILGACVGALVVWLVEHFL